MQSHLVSKVLAVSLDSSSSPNSRCECGNDFCYICGKNWPDLHGCPHYGPAVYDEEGYNQDGFHRDTSLNREGLNRRQDIMRRRGEDLDDEEEDDGEGDDPDWEVLQHIDPAQRVTINILHGREREDTLDQLRIMLFETQGITFGQDPHAPPGAEEDDDDDEDEDEDDDDEDGDDDDIEGDPYDDGDDFVDEDGIPAGRFANGQSEDKEPHPQDAAVNPHPQWVNNPEHAFGAMHHQHPAWDHRPEFDDANGRGATDDLHGDLGLNENSDDSDNTWDRMADAEAADLAHLASVVENEDATTEPPAPTPAVPSEPRMETEVLAIDAPMHFEAHDIISEETRLTFSNVETHLDIHAPPLSTSAASNAGLDAQARLATDFGIAPRRNIFAAAATAQTENTAQHSHGLPPTNKSPPPLSPYTYTGEQPSEEIIRSLLGREPTAVDRDRSLPQVRGGPMWGPADGWREGNEDEEL